eukprot:8063889-Pyramimonas_sp.AAC.1
MPCFRLDEKGWPNLRAWGGPHVSSLWLSNLAQIMRASLFTFDSWRPMMELLQDSADAHIPLATVLRGRHWPDGIWRPQLWPSFWRSPAFA